EGVMMFLNHSCEPNVGIQGQIVFVTLRDVVAGEELTLDNGTIDHGAEPMACRCGAVACPSLKRAIAPEAGVPWFPTIQPSIATSKLTLPAWLPPFCPLALRGTATQHVEMPTKAIFHVAIDVAQGTQIAGGHRPTVAQGGVGLGERFIE